MIKEITLKVTQAGAIYSRLTDTLLNTDITFEELEWADNFIKNHPHRFWVEGCKNFGEFLDNNKIKVFCDVHCEG